MTHQISIQSITRFNSPAIFGQRFLHALPAQELSGRSLVARDEHDPLVLDRAVAEPTSQFLNGRDLDAFQIWNEHVLPSPLLIGIKV